MIQKIVFNGFELLTNRMCCLMIDNVKQGGQGKSIRGSDMCAAAINHGSHHFSEPEVFANAH